MRRRDVLRVCASGLAASVAASAAGGADTKGETGPAAQKSSGKTGNLAGVCGLFCGGCVDMRDGRCHGCGCSCGQCIAADHAAYCKMVKCAARKNLSNCGDCKNFPCSDLIMHTHDPVRVSHAVCLDNLRRRKAVGTDAWIEEQQKFWADEDNRKKWAMAIQEAKAKIAALKKDGYSRAF